MNNKNNNQDINIKTIWKFLRSDKGKTYSFFVFYFFFFIFLSVLLSSAKSYKNNNKNESNLPFKTSIIENNNYNFKYIIKTNYNEMLYQGEKVKYDILVLGDEGEYAYNYRNGNLINVNVDNKILNDELFDIYVIKKIIKSSKLISETKLNDDNSYIYNYKIKSNILDKYFIDDVKNDLDNEIIIKTDSKKNIKSIEFDLLNYEKELNRELELFKINIEYEVNNE